VEKGTKRSRESQTKPLRNRRFNQGGAVLRGAALGPAAQVSADEKNRNLELQTGREKLTEVSYEKAKIE